MNPLLEITPRVPFDLVKAEHVEPAIDELLRDAAERLEQTISSENPLMALDVMTERLDFAMSVVNHLTHVATTPELRAAHNAVQPKVSAFYSGLPLNERLWKAIKSYAETSAGKALTGTEQRFLKKTIDSFKRHGAELPEEGKIRLKQLDVELTEITTKFSENVLDATNAFELMVDDEKRLAGLPPSAIAAARASAENKGKTGWRFTLQGPSYTAAMTYLDDEQIRHQLWQAYNTRATETPFDNSGLLKRILELRREKARRLSFRDFADFVLDDRMAHSGEVAQTFLDRLRVQTEARFRQENAELETFAGKKLHPWDVGYWAEKLRVKVYDFDEEVLRPYFRLENVVNGMFEIFGKLFGMKVTPNDGAPLWDSSVRSYSIHDSRTSQLLGHFYADWFPRENKRGGAWMDSLITGYPESGKPHVGLICGNLTPPVAEKPSLLTHREVETIFHEFGHLLHHMLSRVPVHSLSGTNVAWDFVELPSQIMENWCWERAALDLFARHWETSELIPDELFVKLNKTRTYRAANMQMRQLGFGFVDLALHRIWNGETTVLEFARQALSPFVASTLPGNYAMIASFTHLFGDPVGYGAGYYSYKWAEVLDADAFSRFRKEGVFDETVGKSFRENILEKGDSEDPAVLFRNFMGRDPDPNALLERAGLR